MPTLANWTDSSDSLATSDDSPSLSPAHESSTEADTPAVEEDNEENGVDEVNFAGRTKDLENELASSYTWATTIPADELHEHRVDTLLGSRQVFLEAEEDRRADDVARESADRDWRICNILRGVAEDQLKEVAILEGEIEEAKAERRKQDLGIAELAEDYTDITLLRRVLRELDQTAAGTHSDYQRAKAKAEASSIISFALSVQQESSFKRAKSLVGQLASAGRVEVARAQEDVDRMQKLLSEAIGEERIESTRDLVEKAEYNLEIAVAFESEMSGVMDHWYAYDLEIDAEKMVKKAAVGSLAETVQS